MRIAAEQGNAEAQFKLGSMYEGVTEDYVEAVKWYRLAAEQGHAKAQFKLGSMYRGSIYRKGKVVKQDYAEAVKWYRLAAQQGYSDANFFLGCMYAEGEGVTQDYVRAYMWFDLARLVKKRDEISSKMTPEEIIEAQKMAREYQANSFKDCD
ncbi:MAG: tetratricopeptide repeat protein [Methylococcaceae bacterium]